MLRNKFANKFTQISNAVINDNELSLEEKGLFCYLFSKPDGWEFHYNAMKKELKEQSNDTIRRVLKNLVEKGYIKKTQSKKPERGGKFGGMDIEFTDKSFLLFETKNAESANTPYGENTDSVNLAPINTNISNNTDKANNTDITILPAAKSEEFALERGKEISIQEAEKERKKALVTARNAVFSHFCELYSNLSGGRQYLPKKSEFVLLTRLLKTYTSEEIKEKIGWLYVGCAKGLFWFAKNIGDFTLGKLYSQWNNILPQFTEEQKKEAQKQKEDEELRRRVMENVREAQSSK